jgi:hypothetical protein
LGEGAGGKWHRRPRLWKPLAPTPKEYLQQSQNDQALGHLSQKHPRDSVNLLNDLPCGKELVYTLPKIKRAGNLAIANPL